MAEIRLNKLMRDFNIGLGTLVDFLHTQGIWDKKLPSSKVPDTILPALRKRFGKDKLIAESASKTPVKVSAITKGVKEKNKERKAQKQGLRPSSHLNRKSLPKQDVSSILVSPPKAYAKRVKIKSINRPHRVITEAFDNYKAGVLFPKDITYKGQPIAITYAEALIKTRFKVGGIIHCRITGSSQDGSIAFLSCEISSSDQSEIKDFDKITPGAKYPVRLIGKSPNYFLVSIVGTQIRGLVLKDQFDEGADIDKRGNVRLQLVDKPENPFQFAHFVKAFSIGSRVPVKDLDSIVTKFLRKEELDVISPEDLATVHSILSQFPDLERKKADQVTGIQLYCRVPEKSLLQPFIKQNHSFFKQHSFWVTVNSEDDENPSIILFTETPTVVVELRAFSDDVFTVYGFDARRTSYTRNILIKYNKRTRLKISGKNLHFLSRYDPVPVDFNTEDVIDCISRLYTFNSQIIPGIQDAIREKTLLNTKDYNIMLSFLKYQQDKEYRQASDFVYISPNRIRVASGVRLGDAPSLRFSLTEGEYSILNNVTELEDNDLYVSIVNEEGEELLTGELDFAGDEFLLRFKRGHLDFSDYLKDGIRLRRSINIKHLQIQRNAIEDFIRHDSLDIYQDLINNRMKTPDIELVQDLVFFNPQFNLPSQDNNQSEAVKKAVGNKSVVLIQGPPGTGKTTIIVEIIEQLVSRGKKVLVCSQAHAAVNNIFERLRTRCPNMKILALDDKDEITIAADNFDNEDYKNYISNNISIISALNKNVTEDQLHERIGGFIYKTAEQTKIFRKKHSHIVDYHSVINNIPPQQIIELLVHLKIDSSNIDLDLLKAHIYREKDVILGTCIGIGMDSVLKDKNAVRFDTVIVDEAGKANLAETIVPLRLGDRFVLVGDHRQLPPYFDRDEIADFREKAEKSAYSRQYSQEEVEKAMDKSLFSDFFDHKFFPAENKVTLNYQFRMNPIIGQYISNLFYEGRLLSGEGTEKQTVSIEGYPDPVTFFDTDVSGLTPDNDPRETRKADGSFFNLREVRIICREILPNISVALDADPELTVGIITPYKAQYGKLREALRDTRFRDSVFTIDSIQGSEFDIVVFSFVRAFSLGSSKKVGFLDDLRRLNVSLSRAKKKLILVGHLPTLQNKKAHREDTIPGMVSPVQVFDAIADRVKRIGELTKTERFMQYGFEKGHIFSDCEYHYDEYPSIIIHLADFDFPSRVSSRSFGKYEDGDYVDVILSGFDATGRPLFESADLFKFLQNHKKGENYEAVVSHIRVKDDGWKVVKVTVDGMEFPLNIPAYMRKLHPEYLIEGAKLVVNLDNDEDNPDQLFFRPYRTEADRMLSTNLPLYLFTASIAELGQFPLVHFCFHDGSKAVLECPVLWHSGYENTDYKLVKVNGNYCRLNDDYYRAFIKTHQKNAHYQGLIVSEDKDYYYVEVDDYCGLIEKKGCWMKNVEIEKQYTVVVSEYDSYKKRVYFKIV